jgi:hypothetical protein
VIGILPGPGDIARAQMAREEAARERWLDDADEMHLRGAGVCQCRGAGCDLCDHTGEYVRCQDCDAQVAPGQTRCPECDAAERAFAAQKIETENTNTEEK